MLYQYKKYSTKSQAKVLLLSKAGAVSIKQLYSKMLVFTMINDMKYISDTELKANTVQNLLNSLLASVHLHSYDKEFHRNKLALTQVFIQRPLCQYFCKVLLVLPHTALFPVVIAKRSINCHLNTCFNTHKFVFLSRL